MLTTYHLVEFIRPADRGACSPFVGRGVRLCVETQNDLFVNTKASFRNRPVGANTERLTASHLSAADNLSLDDADGIRGRRKHAVDLGACDLGPKLLIRQLPPQRETTDTA